MRSMQRFCCWFKEDGCQDVGTDVVDEHACSVVQAPKTIARLSNPGTAVPRPYLLPGDAACTEIGIAA